MVIEINRLTERERGRGWPNFELMSNSQRHSAWNRLLHTQKRHPQSLWEHFCLVTLAQKPGGRAWLSVMKPLPQMTSLLRKLLNGTFHPYFPSRTWMLTALAPKNNPKSEMDFSLHNKCVPDLFCVMTRWNHLFPHPFWWWYSLASVSLLLLRQSGRGSKLESCTYRSINLTPVLCKIMEISIRESLMANLISNNLLIANQHSFLTGRVLLL